MKSLTSSQAAHLATAIAFVKKARAGKSEENILQELANDGRLSRTNPDKTLLEQLKYAVQTAKSVLKDSNHAEYSPARLELVQTEAKKYWKRGRGTRSVAPETLAKLESDWAELEE